MGAANVAHCRSWPAYADIWNGEGDPAIYAHKSALLDELCRQQGRPGGSIRRTVGLPPPLIREDRDEAVLELSRRLTQHGSAPEAARAASLASPLVGSVRSVTDRLLAYHAAGAEEVIFDWPAPADEATLEALIGPVREGLAARGA